MTVKEYRTKYDYSSDKKAKESLKYVENIKICPYCKKITIPEDAVAYYVPDKRKMRNKDYKKYYYVLDAIIQKKLIIKELTGLDIDECKTIIKELRELNYITLLNGRQNDSLNSIDYIANLNGINWKNAKTKELEEFIKDILFIVKTVITKIA